MNEPNDNDEVFTAETEIDNLLRDKEAAEELILKEVWGDI